MRTAYFNCSSGIAGDMLLAALIDAGIAPAKLENAIKRNIKLGKWKLKVNTAESLYHIPVKQVNVSGEQRFASPMQMLGLIKESEFSDKVRKTGINILNSLINAESEVHGISRKKIHFHELNSIDTMIDILGVCAALEILEIDEVISSPVNIGCPAPATIKLIKDRKIPVYSSDSKNELATPTGIAIISCISSKFCDMPLMEIEKSGIGAGTRKINANILRVFISKNLSSRYKHGDTDQIVLLETNIDDMDPRIYPYIMEKVFSAGAKDVWLTQVLMKKGRPGIVLSIICKDREENKIAGIVFKETTTLGIRRQVIDRHILQRNVKGGEKYAYYGNNVLKTKSEYEIIKKTALNSDSPLYEIMK